MTWRSLTAVLIAAVAPLACSSAGGPESDSDPRPEVTVMGTTTDLDQPSPTLGSAISTER